jgi:hypothetical protein
MKKKFLHGALMRMSETLVTVMIVLGFFTLFATLLTRLFVPGTSLKQLIEKSELVHTGGIDGSERSAVLDAGGREGSLGDAFKSTAVLSQALNEVKSKRSDSIAWGPAKKGMMLYNRDAVQTLMQSSAQISFDKQNSFNVASNSLVIIRRVEKDLFRSEKHSSMVVLEGELEGKLSGSSKDPLNLDITTPSGVARMKGASATDRRTDFRVSTNNDQSSSIVVYKGQAEVTAHGKTVRIPENTGLIIKPGELPTAPVPLPAAPLQVSPADRSVHVYRNLPPKISFVWAPLQGVEAFHFQIARDPAFKEMVLDKRLGQTEFTHGNLKKGVYYWRVSSIKEGCEGRYGTPQSLELVQDFVAPHLQVIFPSAPVEEDRFVLSGTTEPGASIFLSGKQVKVANTGAFSQEVKLKQGVNLITIEAVDAAGNVSYRSHYIQGRF